MVMKTPAFKLVVNGEDATEKTKPHFVEISVTDDAKDESDALELVLVRQPTLVIPQRGAILEASIGFLESGLIKVGRYVVDEREIDEDSRLVVLRCKGTPLNTNPRYKQMQSQKTQAWQAGTLGVVLQSIAKRNGLNASISPSLAGIPMTAFYQRQESDLHLVQRLAKTNHATFKINGGSLIFQALGSLITPTGQSLPLHRFNAQEVSSLNYSDGGRGEGGSCVARYRSRTQKKAESISVGTGEPVRRLKGVFPSLSQAQQAASAHLKQTQKSSRRLSLKLPLGDTSIFALHKVTITGTTPPIAGVTWQIIRVTHNFDLTQGLTTQLNCEGD
ncbi:MAG: hypothetical protein HEQ32_01880 [Vampirovibrio sp.]